MLLLPNGGLVKDFLFVFFVVIPNETPGHNK